MDPTAAFIKDAIAHPFATFERDIVDYVPNTLSSLALVSCFAAGCMAMFASTHAIIQKYRPEMSRGERFWMMWFVMCGFIHFFFEGEPPHSLGKLGLLLFLGYWSVPYVELWRG
jgi:cholestenol Delta-isomerase